MINQTPEETEARLATARAYYQQEREQVRAQHKANQTSMQYTHRQGMLVSALADTPGDPAMLRLHQEGEAVKLRSLYRRHTANLTRELTERLRDIRTGVRA